MRIRNKVICPVCGTRANKQEVFILEEIADGERLDVASKIKYVCPGCDKKVASKFY